MDTAAHLTVVIRHFRDLEDLATTKPHDAWPPPSLQTYLRTPEEYDPADRQAPVRLHVIDTARHITRELVHAADRIAADIQRTSMSHAPRDAGWTPTDRALRDAIADDDAADPRRWRFVGTRTAPDAARWLHARWQREPGPFEPLTLAHRFRIATVAAGCAEHIEHALGLARRRAALHQPCSCGGTLELHGGDGTTPAIICANCGRTWRLPETAAA